MFNLAWSLQNIWLIIYQSFIDERSWKNIQCNLAPRCFWTVQHFYQKIFFLSKNLLPSFLLIFLLNLVCAVSYELWSEKCLKSAKKYKQYLCVQIIWWYHILYCPCLLCFAIYVSVHYYSVKRLLQQRKREGKK